MKCARQLKATRNGVAAVEFAVVLPLLFLLLMGIWEVGRVIHVRQTVVSAAHETGWQAAAGTPISELPDVVTEYLAYAGLPTANVQVAVDSTVTLPSGEKGYGIEVSIPIGDVRCVLIQYFTDSTDVIQVESVWPRS